MAAEMTADNSGHQEVPLGLLLFPSGAYIPNYALIKQT
jgi:hypothetical protein